MGRSDPSVNIDFMRLSNFAKMAPSLILLEELLYSACLRVAQSNPWKGAIRGTEIYPNTRGVEEAFEQIWTDLETDAHHLIDELDLDRNTARRYLEARRAWDPQGVSVDSKEMKCSFYFGCPTVALEDGVTEDLKAKGVLNFHRDHWRPNSMGGQIIQILCAVHNRLKGSSLLLQPDVVYEEGT